MLGEEEEDHLLGDVDDVYEDEAVQEHGELVLGEQEVLEASRELWGREKSANGETGAWVLGWPGLPSCSCPFLNVTLDRLSSPPKERVIVPPHKMTRRKCQTGKEKFPSRVTGT